MTWRKYFKPVNSVLPSSQSSAETSAYTSASKYNNWLPEVYAGPPDRIQRYAVYDQMNYDHEISAALDTIADFGTELDPVTKLPFVVNYNDEPTPAEIQVIEKTLSQWARLNKLTKRIWRMFRSTLVYGDQFFLRDPETFKLYWIDPSKVEKVIVNESEGKKIESYFVKDIDLNLKNLVATNQLNRMSSEAFGSSNVLFSPPMNGNVNYVTTAYGQGGLSNYHTGSAVPVDAEHVVQLSLTEGMNAAWPFGLSILEQIYKVFKQKELLEDAILIYRIHRAPERRMFFIDVGTMPPNKAHQYVERVKYEVQQKRIPSRNGGGTSIVDSTYNPMSMMEDYFFAVTSDGRGSKVETLKGGENLGCFALDTKVDLLDGRSLSIAEISQEINSGEKLWTYSCHPITGELAPGLISWAGKTKSNAKVMRITLDNGSEIVCTPDHKYPILGLGFVEAQDLKIGQSLTPLYKEKRTISENAKLDYEMVYDPSKKAYVYTHRMVADFMRDNGENVGFTHNPVYEGAEKNVRHHLDHNRHNNCPDNIVWMNWDDHREYHTAHGFSEETQKLGTVAAKAAMSFYKENEPEKYAQIRERQSSGRAKWRETLSSEHRAEINKSISDGIKSYFENLDDDELSERIELCVRNLEGAGDRFQWLLSNDAEFREMFSAVVSNGIKHSQNRNPDIWAARSKKITEANIARWKLDGYYNKVFESQKLKYDAHLMQRFTELYLVEPKVTREEFAAVVGSDTEFMEHYQFINAEAHTNAKTEQFDARHLNSLLSAFSTDWEHFKIQHKLIVNDSVLQDLKMRYVSGMSQVEFVKLLSETGNELSTRHLLLSALNSRGIDNFAEFVAFATTTNHRILKIEYLDETMDVGTLTIDIDEKYHDYHTYALSAGVFVKNSIDDLKYFNNKMLRALGVPSSYLPTGPEDGTAAVSDGRVGSAFIQEFRFSKVVTRYQKQVVETLDKEFKLFLKHRGVTIDNSLFDLQFTEPQSFSEYRQLELDSAKINQFTALSDVRFVSKRYLLKRYLGWTEGEMAENERLWREERSRTLATTSNAVAASGGTAGLSDIGITSSGIDNMAPEAGAEDVADTESDMGSEGELGDSAGVDQNI